MLNDEDKNILDRKIIESALTDKSGGNEKILFTCPKCFKNEYTKSARASHKCIVPKKKVEPIKEKPEVIEPKENIKDKVKPEKIADLKERVYDKELKELEELENLIAEEKLTEK